MKPVALLVLLMPPFTSAAADLKIDHVTIAGVHLDALRQAFTAATNVPTEYGGPHANHATEMALISFPDGSYLELIGIQSKPDPAAVAAHDWSKFLQNNAGPCAFALRVADLNTEIAQLKSAGIQVGRPESSGRTRPDGTRISWETVDAGPGTRGSLFPFLIRDITPRENRAFPAASRPPAVSAASARSSSACGIWIAPFRNIVKRSAFPRRAASRMRTSRPGWHGLKARPSCSPRRLRTIPG